MKGGGLDESSNGSGKCNLGRGGDRNGSKSDSGVLVMGPA